MVLATQLIDRLQLRRFVQHRQVLLEDGGEPIAPLVVARSGLDLDPLRRSA